MISQQSIHFVSRNTRLRFTAAKPSMKDEQLLLFFKKQCVHKEGERSSHLIVITYVWSLEEALVSLEAELSVCKDRTGFFDLWKCTKSTFCACITCVFAFKLTDY